jgi:hypothetical protein
VGELRGELVDLEGRKQADHPLRHLLGDLGQGVLRRGVVVAGHVEAASLSLHEALAKKTVDPAAWDPSGLQVARADDPKLPDDPESLSSVIVGTGLRIQMWDLSS